MLYPFPDEIKLLPKADIPLAGCTAYLSQGEDQQVLFMAFSEEVDLPAHSHETQWAVVLSGSIDLTVGGEAHTYSAGDTYLIPKGVVHSGKIHAGYVDVTYFHQKDRYRALGKQA